MFTAAANVIQFSWIVIRQRSTRNVLRFLYEAYSNSLVGPIHATSSRHWLRSVAGHKDICKWIPIQKSQSYSTTILTRHTCWAWQLFRGRHYQTQTIFALQLADMGSYCIGILADDPAALEVPGRILLPSMFITYELLSHLIERSSSIISLSKSLRI
jgi:hypothetical protein